MRSVCIHVALLGSAGCLLDTTVADNPDSGTTQAVATSTSGTDADIPTGGDSTSTGDSTATGEPTATSLLRSFGDQENQEGRKLALAPDGDIVLVGSIVGDFAMDTAMVTGTFPGEEILLARLSPEGVTWWARAFPNNSVAKVVDVRVTDDGDIVLGGYYDGTLDLGDGVMGQPATYDRPIFVARFDGSGALQWSRTFGAEEHELTRLALDGQGNILLCGWFLGELGFGGPSLISPMEDPEPFMAKLTGDGERVWERMLHTDSTYWSQNSCVMEADAGGDVVVLGGNFVGTLDLGAVTLDSVGDDPYLVRFDANGGVVWARSFPSTGTVELDRLVVLDDGTIWVGGWGGNFSQSAPFGVVDFGGPLQGCSDRPCSFIASFDRDGQTLRALTLASDVSIELHDMTSDRAGGVLVTGDFSGTVTLGGESIASKGEDAGFVAQVDVDGQPRWLSILQDATQYVGSEAVRVDDMQRVAVTGHFREQVEIGPLSAISAGRTDLFVHLFHLGD